MELTPNFRSIVNRTAMPEVVSGVPRGFRWGFYSREDPRMHLQHLDPTPKLGKNKVWLERNGRRAFEWDGKAPKSVQKQLYEYVKTNFLDIADDWVTLMIKQGWLTLKMNDFPNNPNVTLIAYPGLPQEFRRDVDLTPEINMAKERQEPGRPLKASLFVEPFSLVVFDPDHPKDWWGLRASRVLWP